MNCIKMISAAAILTASMAVPAFAQEAYGPYVAGPYGRGPQMYYRSYSVPPGSYAPRNKDEYWNQRNFGFSGRDPSRVGGDTPNLNPPGS